MIVPDIRNAIYQMHLAGMSQRQISRQFQISRHTVGQIIRQQGVRVPKVRSDKIRVEMELLQRLYREPEVFHVQDQGPVPPHTARVVPAAHRCRGP